MFLHGGLRAIVIKIIKIIIIKLPFSPIFTMGPHFLSMLLVYIYESNKEKEKMSGYEKLV